MTLFFDEVHNQHAYDDPDGVFSLGTGVLFLSSLPFPLSLLLRFYRCWRPVCFSGMRGSLLRPPNATRQLMHFTPLSPYLGGVHSWSSYDFIAMAEYQFDCFIRFLLFFLRRVPGLWWSVVGFRVSFVFEVAGR